MWRWSITLPFCVRCLRRWPVVRAGVGAQPARSCVQLLLWVEGLGGRWILGTFGGRRERCDRGRVCRRSQEQACSAARTGVRQDRANSLARGMWRLSTCRRRRASPWTTRRRLRSVCGDVYVVGRNGHAIYKFSSGGVALGKPLKKFVLSGNRSQGDARSDRGRRGRPGRLAVRLSARRRASTSSTMRNE